MQVPPGLQQAHLHDLFALAGGHALHAWTEGAGVQEEGGARGSPLGKTGQHLTERPQTRVLPGARTAWGVTRGCFVVAVLHTGTLRPRKVSDAQGRAGGCVS